MEFVCGPGMRMGKNVPTKRNCQDRNSSPDALQEERVVRFFRVSARIGAFRQGAARRFISGVDPVTISADKNASSGDCRLPPHDFRGGLRYIRFHSLTAFPAADVHRQTADGCAICARKIPPRQEVHKAASHLPARSGMHVETETATPVGR